jgi:hypothetical protein
MPRAMKKADPLQSVLDQLGPFDREGCHLSEEQAQREIWNLIERYRECEEALAKRPTPAQMRTAHGKVAKATSSLVHAKTLPGGRDALREVFGSTMIQGIFTAVGSKLRTENSFEAFELWLDDFARAALERASAATAWKGKSWRGSTPPVSLEPQGDPDFLLTRGSYALLGACGKRPKVSRKGRLVSVTRAIWQVANPSSRHKVPGFRNQIDRLNRFRLHSARKSPTDRAQARNDLQNWLQPSIDHLIRAYPKRRTRNLS